MGLLDTIKTTGNLDLSKDELKIENKALSKQIVASQHLLLASKKRSLLVVFQGVDASGKDGALRDVFRKINPAGCNVYSFKKPTSKEFSHDFLWRVHKVCPARGMIQVFNRSHYEDILVPSVEGFIPEAVIEKRYETINHFEKMLENNGTKVLKFYLHISKEKQEERLLDRINTPEKHWKHNDGDWDVREKWEQYMMVYEKIFERCNAIPWHIIPSDSNRVKVNRIAKQVLKALEAMNLEFPPLESDRFTPNYSV